MKKQTSNCSECESKYFTDSSKMVNLCSECAHQLYGYPNCEHEFKDGRCLKCFWNGNQSAYLRKSNEEESL